MSLESCLISVLISSKARNYSKNLKTGRRKAGWWVGTGWVLCLQEAKRSRRPKTAARAVAEAGEEGDRGS